MDMTLKSMIDYIKNIEEALIKAGNDVVEKNQKIEALEAKIANFEGRAGEGN